MAKKLILGPILAHFDGAKMGQNGGSHISQIFC